MQSQIPFLITLVPEQTSQDFPSKHSSQPLIQALHLRGAPYSIKNPFGHLHVYVVESKYPSYSTKQEVHLLGSSGMQVRHCKLQKTSDYFD